MSSTKTGDAASTVLIIGASGIVGTSAVEAFLAQGWNVVALSRRPPEIRSPRAFRHVVVDLMDEKACRDAAAGLRDVTHVVYAALFEKPGLVAGWQEADQMETNLRMIRNILGPLSEGGGLRHVSLLQGTKAYGIHLHAMPIPARESLPRDDHPNFYWLQEDHLVEAAKAGNFSYTIFRPSITIGGGYGVPMSLAAALGAYIAIHRERGEPCGFPGGASFVWEASDARLVAKALAWAATSPAAAGETFNVTNGDVFEWRNIWPAMVRTVGAEPGPDKPVMIAQWMLNNEAVWDRLVERHKLRKLTLKQVLGDSHHYAEFCMNSGRDRPPPPAFMSTVKIRKAGFHEVQDTEEMFVHWLRDLGARFVLPAAP